MSLIMENTFYYSSGHYHGRFCATCNSGVPVVGGEFKDPSDSALLATTHLSGCNFDSYAVPLQDP